MYFFILDVALLVNCLALHIIGYYFLESSDFPLTYLGFLLYKESLNKSDIFLVKTCYCQILFKYGVDGHFTALILCSLIRSLGFLQD